MKLSMGTAMKTAMIAAGLATLPTVANAATAMLAATDYVGISFWTISMAMMAAAIFFLMEAGRLPGKWKTAMTIGALVQIVAAVHYFYMRDVWVSTGETPTVYRYVDWLITVPLQMVEFYFILAAVAVVSAGMFWRLMIGTVAMLAFGYAGESKVIDPFAGFVLGMSGWGYILFEIFAGEAGKLASSGSVNKYVQQSFKTMRFIVTVGWSIYPLGYFFGYLMGSVQDSVLNLVYNLADFVNKIAFCLAIWASAKASTGESH